MPKIQKRLKAQRNAVLAEAKVKEAEAKDADEKEKNAAKIGVAHENKATITGTEREQTENIYDAKGNIIGERKVKESSKDMMKHEEKMKKNHQQEVIFANPSERIVEDAGVLRGVGISQQERDRMALKKIEEERKEDAKHWGGR